MFFFFQAGEALDKIFAICQSVVFVKFENLILDKIWIFCILNLIISYWMSA